VLQLFTVAEAKTHSVQVRFSETQYGRLQAVADSRFGGNVSDALRQAVTDAEVLRMAREDYFRLLNESGPFLPTNAGGEATFLQTALSPFAEFSDETGMKS
jgi:hypothetical protein